MTSAALFAMAACASAGSSAAPGATSPVAARTPSAHAARRVFPLSELPRTRAERTHYLETSHYADVMSFLDSLQRLQVPMWRGTLGATSEGRAIPMVVLSRPQVTTPAAARRLGRPIVYVQANIHAGEVEGKEALQALIRDLATAAGANVLDSIVLVAVPIYNADGNEGFAPQEQNRREQNGPEMVGTRANAQGLDLNRDYVKAEAPETRAALAMFDRWDPDVFVDLHTTDGSYHGYSLTYSPSLDPAALFGGPSARDSLLPVLRRRMLANHGLEVFDYGNFGLTYGGDALTDTLKQGWYTYDWRPRFGTNYYGLRNRIAILSEAYSHDPFARRITSTYAFVSEILSLVATRGAAIRALEHRADSSVVAWGGNPGASPLIPLRARLTTTPRVENVRFEDLVSTGDSVRTQPGVPPGLLRTGHFRVQRMPVYDRFEPTLLRRLPAGYVVPAADTAVARLLALHGVRADRVRTARPARLIRFTIDSIGHAVRPFQGHYQTTLAGRWDEAPGTVPAGSLFVPSAQPLGLVAFDLLEPESGDGLVTWNFFDASLRRGGVFPVAEVAGPVPPPGGAPANVQSVRLPVDSVSHRPASSPPGDR